MRNWPYPFWFAHRGAGKLAPENTLAAFRLGVAHGFHGFECDVKLSADEVPYLLHDDDLDRTTSGRGPANNCLWSDLSRLDAGRWHGRLFAGEPPASLEATAAFCLANQCALNLELKPCPGTGKHTGHKVAEWLNTSWPADSRPPLLSSFQVDALWGAKEAGPQWPLALLLDTMDHDWLSLCQDLGCVAIVAHHTELDRLRIKQAQAQGLRVLAYTVNDDDAAKRLKAWGIDGLITDAIDQFPGTDGDAHQGSSP